MNIKSWFRLGGGAKQTDDAEITRLLEQGYTPAQVANLLDGAAVEVRPPRGNRVLQIPAVAAGVDAIADAVAGADLRVVLADGREAPRSEGGRALAEPRNGWTTRSMLRTMVRDALVLGNSVWRIDEGASGQILGLWRMPAEQVKIKAVPQGLVYEYQPPAGGLERLTGEQVVHIPGEGGLDPRVGASLYHRFPVALRELQYLTIFTTQLFENGGNPSGLLTTEAKLSPKDRASLAESWRLANSRGSARRVPVLDNGVAFLRVGMPPDEVQLIDLKMHAVREVARMLSINPILLQDLERSTYANTAEAYQDFARRTVSPWARRIEAAVRHLLPPLRRAELDISYLTERGIGEISADALAQLAAGVISVNEARTAIGYEAVDGMDELRGQREPEPPEPEPDDGGEDDEPPQA